MMNLVILTGVIMIGFTVAVLAAVNYYEKLLMKY